MIVLLSCLVALSYSAPAGNTGIFTKTVVRTPTSYSSQHLLVTPKLKETYKVLPQYVLPLSDLKLPTSQLAYYYYPQTYTVGGSNLIPLRFEEEEEIPWWQEIWNQIVGEEEEESSSACEFFKRAEFPQKFYPISIF